MVFGLFSKEKSLQRTIDRATNKLAQQADRWGAMERLKEDGSPEALYGLCKRFGITSSRGVEDEVEKNWVVTTLVDKGEAVLEPLRRYMASAQQLSFALKVLEAIVPKPKALEVVDELLAKEPPGYTRDPDRRTDLIRWMGEWSALTDDDLVPRLVPYLADFDENVRFAAIDSLAGRDPARIGGPLITAILRPDEESGRIKRRIADVLVDKKIALGDHAPAVGGALTGTIAQFAVKNGVLVAR